MAVRDLDPSDAPALTRLYAEYEWWADRTVPDVRRALEATEVAVGIEAERGPGGGTGGRLIAAARVLTDYTYYANVFDVVVAADRRGEGVGRELVCAVRDHPDLQSAVGLSLLCRAGLVPFYESVGFERFDPEVEIPEGGEEEVVRMRLRFDDEAG